MSGQPAARVGDLHICPMVDPPGIPHVGGVVKPPGEPTVQIGGQPAARMGDMLQCVSPAPNAIVKGSFVVPIGNMPAARQTDQTAHGGVIALGCINVLIGLAGIAGDPQAATAACNAQASGRTSGSTQQSFSNCGVESSRSLISQATGSNINEVTLLQNAVNNGNASGTPGAAPTFNDGGTGAAGRQQILANNGVASTVQATNMDNIGLAMSQGKGTIVNLDAGVLWAPSATPAGSPHAVNVTGVVYDDAGNPTHVIINDTGTGQCGQRYTVAQFNAATAAHSNSQLNVTNNSVWH